MKDIGTRISTLWVVVMFTMVFADILTFIKPGALQELWAGQAGVHITPGLLLVFAILTEIPIAMIVVSRASFVPVSRAKVAPSSTVCAAPGLSRPLTY